MKGKEEGTRERVAHVCGEGVAGVALRPVVIHLGVDVIEDVPVAPRVEPEIRV